MSSKPPKFEFKVYQPAKVAKVANLEAGETKLSQLSQRAVSEIILSAPVEKLLQDGVQCSECAWCRENPWSHYPDFGAWCHYRMEHLVVGSLACEEFRRGEVPPRQNCKLVPAVPAAAERILSCFDCPRHEHDRINPSQGWGRCTLKNRGCYGLRPACDDIG